MPPSTPHHSFLRPYRIRVDNFTTPKDPCYETPALYLLSHTHSDHITGLDAKSFGSRIICSNDAKHMLLNYEAASDRIAFDNGDTSERTRPYSHLKIEASSRGFANISRDLLRPLALNTPTVIQLSDDVTVSITLIDANHCPGAVMFLVEGPEGNFLHTGDFRAESSFVASLKRHPSLQKYIHPSPGHFDPASCSTDNEGPLRTLDGIYLDTACLLSHYDLPSKEEACAGLVELMSLFPPFTRFFINSWTWGYEDILKAVAHAFNSKIHVDRYKHSIYTGVSDPSLHSVLTRDATSSRFHACERWNRCHQVEDGTSGVVYVNPVTFSRAKWDLYFHKTQASLLNGELVTNLICPLSRHSTLPELRAFVKLFRPKLLVPNFLNPQLDNLDWACMPSMFSDCLAVGGDEAIRNNMRVARVQIDDLDYVAASRDIKSLDVGVEIDNVVGEGAEDLAKQWTNRSFELESSAIANTSTREGRIIAQMSSFLGPRGQQYLIKHVNSLQDRQAIDNDSDGDGEETDGRRRTAEIFFASTSPGAASSRNVRNMRNTVYTRSPWVSPKTAYVPLSPGVSLSKPKPSTRLIPPSNSPVHTRLCKMLIASSSPASKERAFHSFFDALQFGKQTSSFSAPSPNHSTTSSRKSIRTNNGDTLGNDLLEFPVVTSSSTPQKHVVDVPFGIPFASPSISPSPCHPISQHSPTHGINPFVLPTPNVSSPVATSQRRSFLGKGRPPMLDLEKMLKRNYSSGQNAQPPLKRQRHSSVQRHPNSCGTDEAERKPEKMSLMPSPASSQVHPVRPVLSTPPPQPSSPVDLSPVRPVPSTPPLQPSSPVDLSPQSRIKEKERRAKAKALQLDIRAKLIRALPPEKISPAIKRKVANQDKLKLFDIQQCKTEAARHVNETMVTKPGVGSSDKDEIGMQQEWRVICDEDDRMDWEKSEILQDDINMQRKEGRKYPRLRWPEKSCIESQSP